MLREHLTSRNAVSLFFFALGFSSLLFQTIVVRESLVVMFGNELVLGTILGIWLAGISLGAVVGSRETLSPDLLPLLLLGVMLLPLPLVSLLRLARFFLPGNPGEYLSFPAFSLYLLVLTLPFTVLVGIAFPLGCQAISRFIPGARGIGRVYLWESAGSLAAGVGFTYLLLNWFDPITILGIAVLLNAGVLFAVLPPARAYVLVVSPFLFLALFFLPSAHRWIERELWNRIRPSFSLLDVTDTPYARLFLTRYQDQTELFQNGQPVLSFPDRRENSRRAAFLLSQHPGPDTVLLIEHGAGGLIRALLHARITRLDYLARDQDSFRFLLPHLNAQDRAALDDPRLRVHFTDGREFLLHPPRRYDVIFSNLPSPADAGGNRFFTEEFFILARDHLSPGGVFGCSIPSSENYLEGDALRLLQSVYATLQKVFPEVIVSPGEPAFIFASSAAGSLSANPETLLARFSRIFRKLPDFVPEEFFQLFPPSRTGKLNATLASGPALINTDARPVTYLLNLILWDRFSDSHLHPLIRFLRGKGFILLLLVPVAGIIALALLPAGRAFAYPGAIFLLGFCLMGMSVAWLYTFQNLFGTLYRSVGMMNAMFMLGLAAGALACSLPHVGNRSAAIFLVAAFLATAGIAMTLPSLPPIIGAMGHLPLPLRKSVLFAGVLLTGFFGGGAFPLASGLTLSSPRPVSSRWAGGILDSSDHIGAAIGGFLGGPFLLPLLGLEHSALVWAGLLGLGILLVLIGTRNPGAPPT